MVESTVTRPRTRAGAGRHPGMMCHVLRWSMAMEQPVRVTDSTGRVTTARVVRMVVDPARDKPQRQMARGASTIVATFEGGRELAVDSIDKVQKRVPGTSAAFEE